MSTNPSRIPAALHTHLARIHAPTLAKPFELDALLALVEAAAARRAMTHPFVLLWPRLRS